MVMLRKYGLVILATSVLAGCGGPLIQKTAVTPTTIPVVETDAPTAGSVLSRDFLMDGFDEDTPANIYCYFLIPSESIQTKAEEALLEKMAQAFWLGLVAGEASLDSHKQTSMAYWPITNVKHSVMNAASLAGKWDAWIEHYHFDRAELVSQRVGCKDTGPALVAGFQPLASMAPGVRPVITEALVIEMRYCLPENYLACFQAVQQTVFKKAVAQNKGWEIDKIRMQLGPWFEERIDQAVTIQKP